MAITYQSVQSAASQDAALVITKPVDLAVGDTMLAGIYVSGEGSSGIGVTTPAGWTLLETIVIDTNEYVLAIFSKTADSSDVAASNFTFTRSGFDSTYHLIGHIVRITDFGIIAGESSENSSASSTTMTVPGFTPTRANTLFVAFSASTSSSLITTNSVALTTNNPSWTERAETTTNDTDGDSALAVYTATRAEVTATGNITVTYSSSVGRKLAYVASLSSQVDGSINPTTYVNAYAINPYNPSAEADGMVDQPTLKTGRSRTAWSNEPLPTTTWTNEPL